MFHLFCFFQMNHHLICGVRELHSDGGRHSPCEIHAIIG